MSPISSVYFFLVRARVGTSTNGRCGLCAQSQVQPVLAYAQAWPFGNLWHMYGRSS